MPPFPDNLSVIIGASPRVQPLRRRLLRDGVRHLGVATSLTGLRRELHEDEHELIIGCLLLDESMVFDELDATVQLLADAEGFHAGFRCVGLVPDANLSPLVAALGCHCYVRRPEELAGVIHGLARHWVRPPIAGPHPDGAFPRRRFEGLDEPNHRHGSINEASRFTRRFGFDIRDRDGPD